MKREQPLHPTHQALVEKHLSVVHWVIKQGIYVNETIYGFGYEDLFQEGCVWLCKAAISYKEDIASFAVYAKKVVRNGLISYCRNMCSHQKHFQYLEEGEHGELMADGELLSEQTDRFAEYLRREELLRLLEHYKGEYEGVTQLGIEAIAWKLKGMELKEIAALYRVPSNHVGAWISRSAKKLRNNKQFLKAIS